jgi:hypothetical protein
VRVAELYEGVFRKGELTEDALLAALREMESRGRERA